MTLRLAWFATARGQSSQLLFQRAHEAIRRGELDARIVVVFCNRERGQAVNTDAFLDAVEASGTPLETLSSGAWRKRVGGELSTPGAQLAPWRAEYEEAIWERLRTYAPEVGVLAGFMLILPELCERLPLLNLHPALPDGPVGTWQEVIRELIDTGAAESGMMLQRSTRALDRGPVLARCRYSIRGAGFDELWAQRRGPATEDEPLFRQIRAAGVVREPHFLIAALQALAAGRVTVPAADAAGANLDLTAEVEAMLARA